MFRRHGLVIHADDASGKTGSVRTAWHIGECITLALSSALMTVVLGSRISPSALGGLPRAHQTRSVLERQCAPVHAGSEQTHRLVRSLGQQRGMACVMYASRSLDTDGTDIAPGGGKCFIALNCGLSLTAR